jgi:hypothetical protein
MKEELSRLQDDWRGEIGAASIYERLAEAATDPQTRNLLLGCKTPSVAMPLAGKLAFMSWVGSCLRLPRAGGLAGWVCWPAWAGRSKCSANWRQWNGAL